MLTYRHCEPQHFSYWPPPTDYISIRYGSIPKTPQVTDPRHIHTHTLVAIYHYSYRTIQRSSPTAEDIDDRKTHRHIPSYSKLLFDNWAATSLGLHYNYHWGYSVVNMYVCEHISQFLTNTSQHITRAHKILSAGKKQCGCKKNWRINLKWKVSPKHTDSFRG